MKNLIILSLPYKDKEIKIQRTKDWYINATALSRAFGKRFLDWSRKNEKKIQVFQKLEGDRPILYKNKRKIVHA